MSEMISKREVVKILQSRINHQREWGNPTNLEIAKELEAVAVDVSFFTSEPSVNTGELLELAVKALEEIKGMEFVEGAATPEMHIAIRPHPRRDKEEYKCVKK